MSSTSWVDDLASVDVGKRQSTTEHVVDVLRDYLIDGRISSGTRLSEPAITAALNISRNTLREAFHLLVHERLLVYELNRGVFVRDVTAQDVIEVFDLRRVLQLSAIRMVDKYVPSALTTMRAAVQTGEVAAATGDWQTAGTANMRFHQAIVGLVGNTRMDETMRRVLAELRLAFHKRPPAAAHGPYVLRNGLVCDLAERGEGELAASELARYLDIAEAELLAAYAAEDAAEDNHVERQRGIPR